MLAEWMLEQSENDQFQHVGPHAEITVMCMSAQAQPSARCVKYGYARDFAAACSRPRHIPYAYGQRSTGLRPSLKRSQIPQLSLTIFDPGGTTLCFPCMSSLGRPLKCPCPPPPASP